MRSQREVCSSIFQRGLSAFFKNEKIGFVDKTGKIAIDFIYDYANVFEDGICVVGKGDKWGFINRRGKSLFHLSTNLFSVIKKHSRLLRKMAK